MQKETPASIDPNNKASHSPIKLIIQCPNCGVKNLGGRTWCDACGSKLVDETPKASYAESIKTKISNPSEKLHEKGLKYYQNNDFKNAFKCFSKAAEQGNTDAQFELGNMYMKCQGVKFKNPEKAIELYKKAANEGNLKALDCLINGYGKGRRGFGKKAGIASDYFILKYLHYSYIIGYNSLNYYLDFRYIINTFTEYAKNGNIMAQYNLGRLYVYSPSEVINKENAIKWFTKVTEQDIEPALAKEAEREIFRLKRGY